MRSLIVLAVATMLAGCATTVAAQEGTSEPSASPTETSADADAVAKAVSWLEGAVLPPDAVRSETAPQTTPPFAQSYYGWPCSPMEERTGYWTIDGADVVETANWLKEHPTADLIVPAPMPLPEGTPADTVTLGNAPERDSLEGITYTVSRTANGVAIRAEIGVFTDATVCPTLPPGQSFGGPGQG